MTDTGGLQTTHTVDLCNISVYYYLSTLSRHSYMLEIKGQATTYVPYRERYISIYQATVIISCIEVCVHLATICINYPIPQSV